MKIKSEYHHIEVDEQDRVVVQKEGTMLYFRVLDDIGVMPLFRLDIQCQSDSHARRVLEGLNGESTKKA